MTSVQAIGSDNLRVNEENRERPLPSRFLFAIVRSSINKGAIQMSDKIITISEDEVEMLYNRQSNDTYTSIDVRCEIGSVEYSDVTIYFMFEGNVYFINGSWDLTAAGFDCIEYEHETKDMVRCHLVDETKQLYFKKLLELNNSFNL